MELTPEEQEMLEQYNASRPAKKYEDKKARKSRKKSRLYKRPEFYAGAFMVLAVVSGISLAVLVTAIEQVTDVDMLISTAQEEVPDELVDSSGQDYGFWIDALILLRENVVSIILAVVGMFALVAVAIMFISGLYKKNKQNQSKSSDGE